jgi:phosphoserine phosphatase
MTIDSWQLTTPVSAIAFDCDGTLSAIEGVDELAKTRQIYETVATLTAEAMGKTGLTSSLYAKRLDLIKPTKAAVEALAQQYIQHQITDAHAVIQIFHRLKKQVYVISAGLLPAVRSFANALSIDSTQVFAVDIHFDAQGHYLNYDQHSPLVTNQGKREIVVQIKKTYPEIAYVGDGMNDISVMDIVKRFIGYGGMFPRENIAALCDYYIRTRSLAPLLPLTLTAVEFKNLLPEEKRLYQKGLSAIHLGLVIQSKVG